MLSDDSSLILKERHSLLPKIQDSSWSSLTIFWDSLCSSHTQWCLVAECTRPFHCQSVSFNMLFPLPNPLPVHLLTLTYRSIFSFITPPPGSLHCRQSFTPGWIKCLLWALHSMLLSCKHFSYCISIFSVGRELFNKHKFPWQSQE